MAERRAQRTSLLLALQSLYGHAVAVELLDDSLLTGTVELVDPAMKYARPGYEMA